MSSFYDVLKIDYGKCPPDCRACEEACVKEKGRENKGGISRIKSLHIPQVYFHGAMVCVQCGDPWCQQVCPAGAIQKSQADGVVRINEQKCVGCGLCTLACPYGGIYYDTDTDKAVKCDACDGKPKCVEACPYEALHYVQNSPVRDFLRDEDLLSPGTSACAGCPAELALRLTLRILGKNTILFGAPGCAVMWIMGFGTMATNRLATLPCLLTNVASVMTGVRRYYRKVGREVKLVAFVGDGATGDAGFQALSGAAERQENFIYICYDNEGYMLTGIQRSGATPPGAWTTTTPVGQTRHGKEELSKYLPLIMAFHGVPYVATATIAHLEDYFQKVEKAMKVKDGMAYIHLFSPCMIGWRAPMDSAIEICRLAVETNYFPLWEAERGKFRLTKEVNNPKPVGDFTSLMGRFSHLKREEVELLQEAVNARFHLIKTLASSFP